MTDHQDIWKKVLDNIRNNQKTTPVSYNTWIAILSLKRIDESAKAVYLTADNEFKVRIVDIRYKTLLEEAFKEVLGEAYTVLIYLSTEFEEKYAVSSSKVSLHDFDKQRIFDPMNTFDNFVVGNSNRIAHAAAVAVAEDPFSKEVPPPFFLYGDSGLGKPHLMHAIGLHLIKTRPELNILYVSSEMFTNEMIRALNRKDMESFKNKYRKVDVLLIDDIQFLADKKSSKEEFFYTFETLHNLKKQIIISSDKAPENLLAFEDRYKTRFSWGMIASISPADYETRVAILMKKAENFGLVMDDELYRVICYIAERLENNRALEGALLRLSTFSKQLNEPITLRFAKSVLLDITSGSANVITPEKIKIAVSRYFNVDLTELESSTRSSRVAFPRQIAMYLCRNMTDISFEKIGSLFGKRHYSTVMHACEKIEKDMYKDASLQKIIETLKTEIKE